MATGKSSMRTTLIWVALFVLLAFGLRVAFNFEASWDEDTGRYLYSGNDPYYHDRTVRHIMETGDHLSFDEAINYPNGGYNPNPPLFDWTTVPVAKAFDMFGSADAVGLALNLMVALWGALTVIPVYHIGRDLWGRSAGMWGAFFMAVSAPHIGRSVFGFADHDATAMFWIAMSFMFLLKALKHLDHRNYVKDWSDSAARTAGFKAAIAHNKTSFIWSMLAGVSLSATALTWKGYPYALAVMAIAVGLQLLQDHARNKDSTALFLVYLIPLVMVILLPYLLYYRAFPTFIDTTILPSLYVLIGVLVVGAILVPTRDMPSIVVFPALALTGGLGLILLLVVFPSAGETIFTGLGYFQQSKLYTTIAEAQRTELGNVAAQFGFFAFLIAFWGFGKSVRKAWKGNMAHLLMASWGVVAIFMAFAAARFVTNAAPVMAIFMGAAAAHLAGMIGWDEVRRRFRKQHGTSQFKAGMSSMTWKHTTGVLVMAAFLVFPVTWVGVDAATSTDFERANDMSPQRWGAFGIDFGIADSGWLSLFNYMATLDTDVDIEDRPAFIAWWDYGHWATDLGKHPTVADNFQNHYGMAGRFLAAESEEEGVGWLLILLLNDNSGKNNGAFTPDIRAILEAHHPSLPSIASTRGEDAKFDVLNRTDVLHTGAVFELYDQVSAATGKHIGYFGADSRMWPAGGGGIFYAPVFLANKNPDDFVQTVYLTEAGIQLTVEQYGVDKAGNSYQLDDVRFRGSDGQYYDVIAGRAFPEGTAPSASAAATAPGGISLSGQPQTLPTGAFRDSMYARGFGNIQSDLRAPGDGLSHFRAIYEDLTDLPDDQVDYDRRNTVLLQYYSGVTVSGQITDDAGAPLANHEVTFVDGFEARHARTTTDNEGRYEVIAPFALDNDLKLEVRNGGSLVGTHTDGLQFTREQAESGADVDNVNVVIPRGGLDGVVYSDVDGDGIYNASVDSAIAGATVRALGQNTTTGADGRYALSNMNAGPLSLSARLAGYNTASTGAVVPAGGSDTYNLAMTPLASQVNFTVTDNGQAVPNLSFGITGTSATTGSTDGEGLATISLGPGDYQFSVNTTVVVDGESRTYNLSQDFSVVFGGNDQSVAIALTRS